jgi:hypothetical protein
VGGFAGFGETHPRAAVRQAFEQHAGAAVVEQQDRRQHSAGPMSASGLRTMRAVSPARAAARGSSDGVRRLSTSGRPAERAAAVKGLPCRLGHDDQRVEQGVFVGGGFAGCQLLVGGPLAACGARGAGGAEAAASVIGTIVWWSFLYRPGQDPSREKSPVIPAGVRIVWITGGEGGT